MAKIFNRAASADNILILGTREASIQPFNTPNWLDIRIGFFVSLTQPSPNDDTPTGLAQSVAQSPTYNSADWMWLGLKDSSANFPGSLNSSFIGFSNIFLAGTPNVQLFTSDLGYGTGSGYYWRPGTATGQQTFIASQNNVDLLVGPNTIQPHFFQAADPGNPAPSGYYCGMLGFRLTRTSPTSNAITISVPQTGANSSDMAWTNAPTQALLSSLLDPWPSTVVTLGPVSFASVPNALFCYWPWSGSRLRISAWGIFRKS